MGRCALWYLWCACVVWADQPPQSADWDQLITQAEAQVRVGNYDKSLPLYREALRIAEPFGAGDGRLAATLDFLGNTYAALGLGRRASGHFVVRFRWLNPLPAGTVSRTGY